MMMGLEIDGPDKRQEALNEFEERFKDVPRGKISEIMSEATRKLREAAIEAIREKELKNNKLQSGLNQ